MQRRLNQIEAMVLSDLTEPEDSAVFLKGLRDFLQEEFKCREKLMKMTAAASDSQNDNQKMERSARIE